MSQIINIENLYVYITQIWWLLLCVIVLSIKVFAENNTKQFVIRPEEVVSFIVGDVQITLPAQPLPRRNTRPFLYMITLLLLDCRHTRPTPHMNGIWKDSHV